MEGSPRLIDLIPRRLTTIGLWLLAGLVIVAALEGLYAWMPQLAPMTSDGRVAAFDLDGEGSLAVWFSSVVLLLAALVSVLVYSVRRHKLDDYQGFYRVWLWAAMCWLLMSIDEAASLHEGFKQLMVWATGTPLYGDGSLWWVIPYFFLLGAVGTRLLVDMRHCRLSTAALLLSAGCYATAVAVQLLTDGNGGARAVMLEEGAEMVADLLLLMAMTLHARYVLLDAEGLLGSPSVSEQQFAEQPPGFAGGGLPRGTSSGQPREVAAATGTGSWTAVDTAHPSAPAAHISSVGASVSGAGSPAGEVRRKLTKAERKALRKRLLQQRLQRERQARGKWG